MSDPLFNRYFSHTYLVKVNREGADHDFISLGQLGTEYYVTCLWKQKI